MIASLSTPLLLGAFTLAGLIVVISSIKATGLADVIADRTRIGEALAGGIVLGAATSLSGIVVSVSVAAQGDASFAFSNAVGGIAAQTFFLALADMLHRRANLEHSAAEPANLFQAVMLIVLLSIPLAATAAPDYAIWGISPASVILFLAYLGGTKLAAQVSETPMWKPVETRETRHDEPEDEEERNRSPRGPILVFVGLVVVMGLSGWVISQAGREFVTRFGLSSSLVGALLTAVVTSLPELVTTLTAVRRGALQLAIGGIIGGNTFDTLFLVFSDGAYREGSLYHAVSMPDLYWLATGLMMTGVLLGGLILRQKNGPARIGIESLLLVAIYASAVVLQVLA